MSIAMMRHLIVPVDGSEVSWRAVDVAIGLARVRNAVVQLVRVVHDPVDVTLAHRRLDEGLSERDAVDVDVRLGVRLTHGSVASAIEQVANEAPGSIVVMSSLGRGRSAAVVGSVAQDVLRRIGGPVVLVGPMAATDFRGGPVVLTLDGTEHSEVAIPVAAVWAESLQTSIWITKVIAPPSGWAPDYVHENGYLADAAARIANLSGSEVDFDILHHSHPGKAVVDDAHRRSASLIVASSRGRDGLSRVLLGSVSSELFRRASCPSSSCHRRHRRRPTFVAAHMADGHRAPKPSTLPDDPR